MNQELLQSLIRILPFLLLITVFALRIRQGKFSKESLYLQQPSSLSRSFMWWCGFVVFALLVEFILWKLNALEIDPWNHTLLPSIIRIMGAVLLAPIAEEIFFRGFLLSILTGKHVNKHVAILIQAAIFVALHSFAYQNTLSSNISIVQSFIDAMLYAYAKYDTDSLSTPIAMHMAGNAIATIERFVF